MQRRSFVKNSVLASAGFSILPSSSLFAQQQKIKLGFIGVGLRGQDHLEMALRRNDTDVIAICDIDDRMLGMAGKKIKEFNKPAPKIFTGDPYAWRRLLELKELDAVLIATPWEWHAPMCIESLQAKKYVATEVMLGITLQE